MKNRDVVQEYLDLASALQNLKDEKWQINFHLERSYLHGMDKNTMKHRLTELELELARATESLESFLEKEL